MKRTMEILKDFGTFIGMAILFDITLMGFIYSITYNNAWFK